MFRRRVETVPGEVFVTILREGYDIYRSTPDANTKQSAFDNTRKGEEMFFKLVGNRITDWEGEFDDKKAAEAKKATAKN